MKHIKLYEQFVNEKKNETYIAYVDDKRTPGGSDKEIKNDYNLDVKDRNSSGFSIVGTKEDIESFINDYSIILDDGIQVFEKAYQLTGIYGAKGIIGKVAFAFKKEVERVKYEGDADATIDDLNSVWSKWADKDGAKIIEQEVMKQVKDKEAVVNNFKNSIILRPSIVFGTNDNFFNLFNKLINLFFFNDTSKVSINSLKV